MALTVMETCVYGDAVARTFGFADALVLASRCLRVCAGQRAWYAPRLLRTVESALGFGHAQRLHHIMCQRSRPPVAPGSFHPVTILTGPVDHKAAIPEMEEPAEVYISLWANICSPSQAHLCVMSALHALRHWEEHKLCKDRKHLRFLVHSGTVNLCLCTTQEDAMELMLGFGVQAVRRLPEGERGPFENARDLLLSAKHPLLTGRARKRVRKEARRSLPKPHGQVVQQAVSLFTSHLFMSAVDHHGTIDLQERALLIDLQECALLAMTLNLCRTGMVLPVWHAANLEVPAVHVTESRLCARIAQFCKQQHLVQPAKRKWLPASVTSQARKRSNPTTSVSNFLRRIRQKVADRHYLANTCPQPNKEPLETPEAVASFIWEHWCSNRCPHTNTVEAFVLKHLNAYDQCIHCPRDCTQQRIDYRVLLLMLRMPSSWTLVPTRPNNCRKEETAICDFAKCMLLRYNIPAAAVASQLPEVLSMWRTPRVDAKLRVFMLCNLVDTVNASNEYAQGMHRVDSWIYSECEACYYAIMEMLAQPQWTQLFCRHTAQPVSIAQGKLVTALLHLLYTNLSQIKTKNHPSVSRNMDAYRVLAKIKHLTPSMEQRHVWVRMRTLLSKMYNMRLIKH